MSLDEACSGEGESAVLLDVGLGFGVRDEVEVGVDVTNFVTDPRRQLEDTRRAHRLGANVSFVTILYAARTPDVMMWTWCSISRSRTLGV